MSTPDTHPVTSSHSWFLSADWAVLSSELAALFFVFALIVGILAWRARRQRLHAARALLDQRESIADTATETFEQHLSALLPGISIPEEVLGDYRDRCEDIVGILVEPWLEPSPRGLQNAAREIMSVRQTDLHQVAAIFRAQPGTSAEEDKSKEAVLAQLKTDLTTLQKAEAERSAQLAEALKSVSIIVSEYGRKFDVEADFRVPQILRTLIYLQGVEQGMDHDAAMSQADTAMAAGVDLMEDEKEPAADPPAPRAQPKAEEAPSSAAAPAEAETAEDVPAEEDEPTELASQEAVIPPEAAVDDLAEKAFSKDEVVSYSDDGEIPEAVSEVPEQTEQIDLDDIELPEAASEQSPTDPLELNLDDIDALLDAEIAKQQASYSDTDADESGKAPSLSDDDLDLSKKPPA